MNSDSFRRGCQEQYQIKFGISYHIKEHTKGKIQYVMKNEDLKF